MINLPETGQAATVMNRPTFSSVNQVKLTSLANYFSHLTPVIQCSEKPDRNCNMHTYTLHHDMKFLAPIITVGLQFPINRVVHKK